MQTRSTKGSTGNAMRCTGKQNDFSWNFCWHAFVLVQDDSMTLGAELISTREKF